MNLQVGQDWPTVAVLETAGMKTLLAGAMGKSPAIGNTLNGRRDKLWINFGPLRVEGLGL